MKLNQFCVGIESLDSQQVPVIDYHAQVIQLREALESLNMCGKAVTVAKKLRDRSTKAKTYVEASKEYNKTAHAIGLPLYSSLALESFNSPNAALESIMDAIKGATAKVINAIKNVASKMGQKTMAALQAVRRFFSSTDSRVNSLKKKLDQFPNEDRPFNDVKLMKSAGFGTGGESLTEVVENANKLFVASDAYYTEVVYAVEDFVERGERFKVNDVYDRLIDLAGKVPLKYFKQKLQAKANENYLATLGSIKGLMFTVSTPKAFAGDFNLYKNIHFDLVKIPDTEFTPMACTRDNLESFLNFYENFKNIEKKSSRIFGKMSELIDDGWYEDEDGEYYYDPDKGNNNDLHECIVIFLEVFGYQLDEKIADIYTNTIAAINSMLTYCEKSASN